MLEVSEEKKLKMESAALARAPSRTPPMSPQPGGNTPGRSGSFGARELSQLEQACTAFYEGSDQQQRQVRCSILFGVVGRAVSLEISQWWSWW
jgi:hypothetical protein